MKRAGGGRRGVAGVSYDKLALLLLFGLAAALAASHLFAAGDGPFVLKQATKPRAHNMATQQQPRLVPFLQATHHSLLPNLLSCFLNLSAPEIICPRPCDPAEQH